MLLIVLWADFFNLSPGIRGNYKVLGAYIKSVMYAKMDHF